MSGLQLTRLALLMSSAFAACDRVVCERSIPPSVLRSILECRSSRRSQFGSRSWRLCGQRRSKILTFTL